MFYCGTIPKNHVSMVMKDGRFLITCLIYFSILVVADCYIVMRSWLEVMSQSQLAANAAMNAASNVSKNLIGRCYVIS